MMRKSLRSLFVVLLSVFVLGSIAEAAPKKVVRHRVRHSASRVASGTTAAKKRTVVRRRRPAARATTATSAKRPVRRTTTKPR